MKEFQTLIPSGALAAQRELLLQQVHFENEYQKLVGVGKTSEKHTRDNTVTQKHHFVHVILLLCDFFFFCKLNTGISR